MEQQEAPDKAKKHDIDIFDNWTRAFTCTCGQWFDTGARLKAHVRRGNC